MNLLGISYAGLFLLVIGSSQVVIPVSINLILSCIFIIYIGAHRSLDAKTPAMTQKDTYMFPVIGSCVLFSLYVAFKLLGKHYVNLLLGIYFTVLGVFVLQQTLAEALSMVFPSKKHLVSVDYRLPMQKISKMLIGESITFALTLADIVAFAFAIAFSVWHFQTKHFLANNLFGVAFSIQGLEHVALGSYTNGAILLVGLFFYDVFWVFGTDVMVTVAKSFDAPIKLLFLRAHAEADTDAQFSMLGLGDIVIPGIFIALLLRFDALRHFGKQSGEGSASPWSQFPKPLFFSTLLGYTVGLAATLYVMYTWKAAQPALLYLSPACLLFSFIPALLRGEVGSLLKYADEDVEEPGTKKEDEDEDSDKPEEDVDEDKDDKTKDSKTKKE